MKVLILGALGIFITTGVFATKADISFRFVTQLHQNEPYDAHLFHDGFLFVGRTKSSENTFHQIEIYEPQGKWVTSLRLPHTPSFVYPFSKNRVLIVGKSSWPWKTHFTTVQWRLMKRGLEFTPKTLTFPEEIQTEQFGGTSDRMFFNETGAASVFTLTTKGVRFLKPEISGPGSLLLAGNYLYVIERRGFDLGDENLVRIDLRDESADRTFKDALRAHLTEMVLLDNNTLAIAERLANQVLIIDIPTNRLKKVLPVAGMPRSLSRVGFCLVTASEESRMVRFYNQNSLDLVSEWDLSVAGNELKKAKVVTLDPLSGRVYVRSTYICPTCSSSQASVVVAEEKNGKTFKNCMTKPN